MPLEGLPCYDGLHLEKPILIRDSLCIANVVGILEGGVGWARLLPAPTNGESLFSWFDFVVVVVVVVVVVKVGEILVFGFVPLLGCRLVSRCHTTVI